MPTLAERTRLSRVLVVEDHPHQLRTLTELLETEGIEAIGVSTGTEALAALEREEVGIVVVDLHLPDRDGTALLEQLRARSETTRIIIHTGTGTFATAKDAVNLGAFAYIEKGEDPHELISHVHRAREANLTRYAESLEAAVAQRTAELERRFIDLRNLHDLVSRLNSAELLGEIYDAAMDALSQTLRPDRASILLFDPDGVMRFKAWRGLSDWYRQAVEGHSPWKPDTADAQPILISDAAEDASLGPHQSTILKEGIRALAFIPLIAQGRVIGKFMLYCNNPHRLTDEEIRLAQTIAAHVAFAVERKQVEEISRKQLMFSRALNRLADLVIAQKQPSLLLEDMAKILGETLQVDRALVYEVTYVTRQAIGLCEWLNPAHPEITPTKATYDLRLFLAGADFMRDTRRWLESHDDTVNPLLQEDGSARILHEQMSIRSLLWYPFNFGQDRYFALVFNQVTHRHHWKEEELAFLESVIRQVNLALVQLALLEERRRANEKQAQLAQDIQLLLDSTGEGIWGVDLEARCTFLNKAAVKMLGYAVEETLGRNMHQLVHHSRPDGSPYPIDECPIVRSFRTGQGCRVEDDVLWRRDGTSFPVEYSSFPILENGTAKGAVVTFQDVTVRKRAETALHDSETRFKSLYHENPCMYFTLAADGTVLSVNQFGARQLGYAAEELVGRSVLTVFHNDDRPRVQNSLTALLADPDRIGHWEFRKIRKDGALLWVKETARVVQQDGGTPVVLVVCEDITERKRAEEALRRSYEERDRISQDLHDGILQSLYAIGLGLEATKRDVKPASRAMVQRLDGSIVQLNALVQEVRSFIARVTRPAGEVWDLVQAIQALRGLFAATGAGEIAVQLDPSVAASFSSEQSAHLVNVVKEALSNSMRHARAAHRSVTLGRFREGIRLEIRDDGVGFRVSQRRGAGMGLSTMRARAKKLGGRLSIISRPGHGTRVVLDLPPALPEVRDDDS